MPERKISRVSEYWNNIREQIEGELGDLLAQGRVLTTPDVAVVSSKYGYSPRSLIAGPTSFSHFGEDDEEGFLARYIGPVRIVEESVGMLGFEPRTSIL